MRVSQLLLYALGLSRWTCNWDGYKQNNKNASHVGVWNDTRLFHYLCESHFVVRPMGKLRSGKWCWRNWLCDSHNPRPNGSIFGTYHRLRRSRLSTVAESLTSIYKEKCFAKSTTHRVKTNALPRGHAKVNGIFTSICFWPMLIPHHHLRTKCVPCT